MYNIVAAVFDVESEGYQAMSTLSRTPIIQETSILQMALVKRGNGALKLCDSYDSGIHTTDDMLLGDLLGGLVGILGGPLGVLLMGSYGALVDEVNEDELDSRLNAFKVTIARFDAVVIAEEVEQARGAEAEMERLARMELRAAKKEERKDRREAKKAEISADFAAFKARFRKD